MAVFERPSGGGVAERVRPAPGSAEEKDLERLAADRVDGWRKVETPKAQEPADPLARPDGRASKDAWVAHVVAAHGLAKADASAMTKADLVAYKPGDDGDA